VSTKTVRRPAEASGPRPVEFTWQPRDAKSVHVAGGFNDWKPDAAPLQHDRHGIWRTELRLPPGRHEFKFIVDGVWYCDPSRPVDPIQWPDCVPNPFGTLNRVLEVA